ncbi:serine/threonine-protein kinase [Streptomyces sp. NPDC006540]|uniref:serine/threonine-protein kinase n=1 Tax=Streptomyces sp. NPDC006540 TaxID=3155353 RepID=UPI0033BA14F4
MSDGGPGRRVIDGRFELEGRLGGGGMGTVWRARDVVLDRAVALKEVRPPDPGLAEYDPEAARMLRARVLREARALARVEHPNVVTIHHVVDGGEDTYPWLVMELVTGGSLAERLAEGPMAPAEAARLGREVLAALRAAHDAGIQHRDVKPANVLLRPDGRPVLTDFGIAAIRESTALTVTGSVIGTPDYMAPERISGDDGGPGSDLWSLAMMLYVAVEGHHPLRRGSTLATLAAVLNDELPPPRQAGPLAAVLAAVLVKDPAARPGPEAVDRMLAEVVEGRPPERVDAEPVAAGPEVAEPVDAVPTSYRLSPPATPGPHDAVPPRGAAVSALRQHALGMVEREETARREEVRRARLGRRIAIGSSITATVLAGVLVWALLPDGDKGGEAGAKPSGPAVTGQRTPTPTPPSPTPSKSAEQVDLLTPDGIRTAVADIKAKTGTDRVGSLTVYPEHVSADVMVDGDDRRYESWIYRVGKGAEKGIISGTLSSGDRPFSLDDFDWDVVPALLERAREDLNVKDPTTRYLVAREPSTTLGTPLGLGVYLSDEYGASGYLDADLKGKVTRVYPYEG